MIRCDRRAPRWGRPDLVHSSPTRQRINGSSHPVCRQTAGSALEVRPPQPGRRADASPGRDRPVAPGIRNLPGVNIIPLGGNRAFLALDIDRGMSDLELAVSDRLGDPAIDRRERRALAGLRAHLTTWRRDHELQFHTRAIIVVERLVKTPMGRDGSGARRGAAAKRTSARAAAGPPGGPPVSSRGVLRAGLAGEIMSTRNPFGRIT